MFTLSRAHQFRKRWLSPILFAYLLGNSAQALAEAAVAASDEYGAKAAQLILEKGGNAVDAAVATAFTLAVTFPEAGNIGGGGFATVWFKNKAYFVDYRESAPLKSSANMYLDAAGEVREGLSTQGGLAAGIPGTVKGMWELHRRFGTLPWSKLLQPAIDYAQNGFKVSSDLAQAAKENSDELQGKTNFASAFGRMRAGERFKQPELARVLKRIQASGPMGFYQGLTARQLVADVQQQGGIWTLEDLRQYQVHWRQPLVGHWHDLEIITAPPPSSGGIALLSLIGMKERLSSSFSDVKLNSPEYVHLICELEKRVFADRGEVLGDPDFYPVPVAMLLDAHYLDRRAAEVSKDKITPTNEVKSGISTHHNTTHFSIVDHEGNAVSNTYTLNDEFGARTVSAHTGILLNNEMDDFSIKPGVPNIYGVIGGEANAIAPKKRPLSSMTPTIVLKDSKVTLVIGTPGGSRIFTSVFQAMINWNDFHLPLKEAVSAVRFHHQLLPENLIFEEPYGSLDQPTKAILEKQGYRFENQGWNGDIQALALQNGHWVAVSDPRGRGYAQVVDRK
jgi:gamma-glutamyltranspeptidase / glutathione hydrolase